MPFLSESVLCFRPSRVVARVIEGLLSLSRKHPSRDVIFPKLAPTAPKIITVHDVVEPLKQALWASCDVIISTQICGSKLQTVFTLGDGCGLPTERLPTIVVNNRRVAQKEKPT